MTNNLYAMIRKIISKIISVLFSVEISPVGHEDLIYLPPKIAKSLGNLGPPVICTKVTKSIALLNPITLRQCCLDADHYWRTPFKPVLNSRQLVECVILDVDIILPQVDEGGGSKYTLAYAQVACVSDFGKNDTIFNITTHLGSLLNPGDYALGYDLYGANSNDIELDKYKGLDLPDAIFIKKISLKNNREYQQPSKIASISALVNVELRRVVC